VLIRDVGLLDPAVHRPRATVFRQDAYADLFVKAAALLHSLAHDHALVDARSCGRQRECRGRRGHRRQTPHVRD
jgi:death-on-curing protein